MNVHFSLQEIPESEWPTTVSISKMPFRAAIVDGAYLAQCYEEADGIVRLTINSTVAVSAAGTIRWLDGIPWDHLQEIKRVMGYGELEAFEVYPPDSDVVDRAAMRHLWILPNDVRLPFSWKSGDAA